MKIMQHKVKNSAAKTAGWSVCVCE